MSTVVLASNNKGKVKEIGELLADQNMQVVPQSEFGVTEAEETGEEDLDEVGEIGQVGEAEETESEEAEE